MRSPPIEPSDGAGGDSSYATVAFQERLSNGIANTISGPDAPAARVAVRRARQAPTGSRRRVSAGRHSRRSTVSEYGAASSPPRAMTPNALYAMSLGTNGVSRSRDAGRQPRERRTAPDGVPAMAGLYSRVIAWQHDPGLPGAPEIRMRFAPAGSDARRRARAVLAEPRPGRSPTAASRPPATPPATRSRLGARQPGEPLQIVTDAALPGARVDLAGHAASRIARTAQPLFAWSAARDRWGPIRYTVTLDGAPLPQTTATSLAAPEPLADGPHNWQVTATNPAGLTSTARAVERLGRCVAARRLGHDHRARSGSGRYLHLSVSDTDAPPPEPPTSASGIASA